MNTEGLGWKWDETAKRLDFIFEVSVEGTVIGGMKTSLDGLPEMPPNENIEKAVACAVETGIPGMPDDYCYKPITWPEYVAGGYDNNNEDEG